MVEVLPQINAILNLISLVFLLFGYIAIKNGKQTQHKKFMLSAFFVSMLFLLSYLLHKYFLYVETNSFNASFKGEGIYRTIYFIILIPHITLAISVPILAIVAIRFALKENFSSHKKIVKFAYPIWLYVSITGVLVYLMLYQFFK